MNLLTFRCTCQPPSVISIDCRTSMRTATTRSSTAASAQTHSEVKTMPPVHRKPPFLAKVGDEKPSMKSTSMVSKQDRTNVAEAARRGEKMLRRRAPRMSDKCEKAGLALGTVRQGRANGDRSCMSGRLWRMLSSCGARQMHAMRC